MHNPLQLRFRGMGQNFEPIEATGGAISYATVDNVTYKIHKFTSGSSTFTVKID